MKFVTIGGGSIGRHGEEPDLTEIDKEIILLSGKKNPQVLFLPTANTCQESYFRVFKRYYKSLGANPSVLYLKGTMDYVELRKIIMSADIIYVGGGNTLKMMNIWKRYGIDKILIEAAESGKIMSGLSAGAICWYNCGNSDSLKYSSGKDIIIKVTGLGLINALVCPHYDAEADRVPSLMRMMKTTYKIIGVALDNCCALEIVDDKYRVLTSKEEANAYKVYWLKGKYIVEKIEKSVQFSSLESLLEKPRKI